MKTVFIISFVMITIFGCAKKMAPPATAPPPPPPSAVIMTADAAKMDAATAAVPAEKMVAMGQETFTAKCGRCHGLKKVDDYTAMQWTSIMERMAIKAMLDSAEKANVLAYVHSNAKAG